MMPLTSCILRCSIVVSISACHAEDPGSIPGGGVFRKMQVSKIAPHASMCLYMAGMCASRPFSCRHVGGRPRRENKFRPITHHHASTHPRIHTSTHPHIHTSTHPRLNPPPPTHPPPPTTDLLAAAAAAAAAPPPRFHIDRHASKAPSLPCHSQMANGGMAQRKRV